MNYTYFRWNKTEYELPESGEDVIVTVVTKHGHKYVAPDAKYDNGEWYELFVNEYEEDLGEEYGFKIHLPEYRVIKGTVVAWMLQPEPYEG